MFYSQIAVVVKTLHDITYVSSPKGLLGREKKTEANNIWNDLHKHNNGHHVPHTFTGHTDIQNAKPTSALSIPTPHTGQHNKNLNGFTRITMT